MHIVLAGMIGAGKTTLSELISEEMGIPIYNEEVEKNPYLEKLYNGKDETDENRYEFLLQLFFLTNRYEIIKKTLKKGSGVIDRSIYEDSHFARINMELGNITAEEYTIYESLKDEMLQGLEHFNHKSKPDVLIYLRGSFETILERISARGRDMENESDHSSYFHKLWVRYDEWLHENYAESPILVVDIDQTNTLDRDTLVDIVSVIKRINISGEYANGEQIIFHEQKEMILG